MAKKVDILVWPVDQGTLLGSLNHFNNPINIVNKYINNYVLLTILKLLPLASISNPKIPTSSHRPFQSSRVQYPLPAPKHQIPNCPSTKVKDPLTEPRRQSATFRLFRDSRSPIG
jgi:hypothetical protein